MIRAIAASLAYELARFSLWRSCVWSRRSEMLADVSSWLDTGDSWATIRARRGRRADAGEGGFL